MPFDGTGFEIRREERGSRPPSDRAICVIIVAIAVCCLAMPISMASLVDIVQFARGR